MLEASNGRRDVPVIVEGDKVTITIDGALSSYQVGDSLSVPVVAAAPLYLSGGQTGTDTLTWTVEGSDYGVMPGIEMPSDDSAHYDSLGIEFDVSHGVIPFAAGDAFTFSLEGATYQYRVDSGSWSSPESLPAISVAIADGLQISFEAGESPSWRELDEFAWTAKQPNAPDHVCSPDWQSWKPQTAPATLTVDIGTAQTLSAFAVWHSLPTGSTVTVSGSADNFSSTLWTKTLTASGEHLSVAVDSTLADCRYVRLTVSGVGKVKWWYAGDPSIPSVHANKVELENHYSTRGGRYMGRARGGEISWGEFLTSADVDNLLEMVEECKSSGNLPVCFIPHHLHLEQARMVRLSLDRISVSDVFHYQPDTDFEPNRFAMSLPLEGVL